MSWLKNKTSSSKKGQCFHWLIKKSKKNVGDEICFNEHIVFTVQLFLRFFFVFLLCFALFRFCCFVNILQVILLNCRVALSLVHEHITSLKLMNSFFQRNLENTKRPMWKIFGNMIHSNKLSTHLLLFSLDILSLKSWNGCGNHSFLLKNPVKGSFNWRDEKLKLKEENRRKLIMHLVARHDWHIMKG